MASIFDIIARDMPETKIEVAPVHFIPHCNAHFNDMPCAQCAEDEARGYSVRMLEGRCANGSELDHGTRWHAVKPDEYSAICGAKPGRRSAGWSSWTVLGQDVTCPRCLKKLKK